MGKSLKYLFEQTKKAPKGLLTAEWVIMGYLVMTLLLILFTYTKLPSPDVLIWGRVRVVALTVAMWGVYRMYPCRFTLLCRVAVQLIMLSWWYADTYELNKIFPNLDHLFASYEQQLFGCQPALLFAQQVTSAVFSELMYLGYVSYFPLIATVSLYYFFKRHEEFNRTVFVILASFFIFYTIFVFLPVTGPQYYYPAAGMDNIAQGIFPNLHDYFATHQEGMPLTGYSDGLLYQSFLDTHNYGERPTAAFPSSHVGITTILLFLAWRSRSRRLFYFILPFYVLMCFATVYIRAHYVIDVIGGWVSATLIYLSLQAFWSMRKRNY